MKIGRGRYCALAAFLATGGGCIGGPSGPPLPLASIVGKIALSDSSASLEPGEIQIVDDSRSGRLDEITQLPGGEYVIVMSASGPVTVSATVESTLEGSQSTTVAVPDGGTVSAPVLTFTPVGMLTVSFVVNRDQIVPNAAVTLSIGNNTLAKTCGPCVFPNLPLGSGTLTISVPDVPTRVLPVTVRYNQTTALGQIDFGTLYTPGYFLPIGQADGVLVADNDGVYASSRHRGDIRHVTIDGGAVTLVTAQNPLSFTVDDDGLFWTDDDRGVMGGDVTALAKGATTPIVLASVLLNPSSITTDAANVYWIEYPQTDPPLGDAILSVPKAGGTVVTVATTDAISLASDGSTLFWGYGSIVQRGVHTEHRSFGGQVK